MTACQYMLDYTDSDAVFLSNAGRLQGPRSALLAESGQISNISATAQFVFLAVLAVPPRFLLRCLIMWKYMCGNPAQQ